MPSQSRKFWISFRQSTLPNIKLRSAAALPALFQKELANALISYDLTRNSKFVATVNGNINQLILSNHLLQGLASPLNGYTLHLPSFQETPEQITNIAHSYLSELNQAPVIQQGYAAIDLSGTLDEITKQVIKKVLEEEGMNQSKAVKRLGISRGTIWKRLREGNEEN